MSENQAEGQQTNSGKFSIKTTPGKMQTNENQNITNRSDSLFQKMQGEDTLVSNEDLVAREREIRKGDKELSD